MNLMQTARMYAGRLRNVPKRWSQAYPKLLGLFGRSNKMLGQGSKPTPSNLRAFSRTPYARRAINTIKNPIVALEWELEIDSESSDLKKRADTLLACFKQPNFVDSFRSLLEQGIEDLLVCGSGMYEIGISGDKARPLWLWPVDTTTVQPQADWDGSPDGIRFLQSSNVVGGQLVGNIDVKRLKAKDFAYMRLNPTSEGPYGFGPLEIAYDSIQRQLGVGRYASNVASNAQPRNMIYIGDANEEQLAKFRGYYTNEVEGRGLTPILGGKEQPKVLPLHDGGDKALYLQWQEFLIREIATAFGISAQNLNLVADVNRNTSETAEDRDWDSAIIPVARVIEEHINRDIIQGRLGMVGVRFKFLGLDREDEMAQAEIFGKLYTYNCVTPNEWREEKGKKPLDSQWGDLCYADTQIGMKAAQGAGEVDDKALSNSGASKPATSGRSVAKQKPSSKKPSNGAK